MKKNFCEFFAGIGLVHEALQASGWRCVYANDIAPQKAAMYRDRFGAADYYQEGDVWATDDVVQGMSAAPFLATASFPCTDMSLAGRMQGFEGAESSAFFGFAKAMEALGNRRPPVLMLENVVGFINSRGGADFQAAAGVLADLGYAVDSLILDARHFVPQSRARLFLFGFHHSLRIPELVRQSDDLFGERWEALVESSPLRSERLLGLMRDTKLKHGWASLPLPQPPQLEQRLVQFLDLDDGQDWWSESQVEKHRAMMSDLHRRAVEEWLANPETVVATGFRRIRQGEQRLEVRRDGIAGCLRTPRGGSARQIVLAVGGGRLRMRWMSAREYARLQGAPDFPLRGSESRSMFGFGDAVCVPAIRWLDDHILSPCFQAAQANRRTAASHG